MSEETTITTTPKAQISLSKNGLQLASLDDLFRFAKYVVASGFAPKGMEKPESILIAVEMGYEVGLSPMAALQNTAIVNGRPTIYGDAALALVRSSGLLDFYEEKQVGTRGKDDFGYCITAKRKGDAQAYSETFTVADAKTAQLWGKAGPWSQYPARMLKFRARGFLLRDAFGDVLKGMKTAEEARDYVDIDVEVVDDKKPKQKLFKAAKPATETEPEAHKTEEKPAPEFVPDEPTKDEPTAEETKQEQPKPESKDEKPLAKLKRLLKEASLTEGQCKAYAGKNGMLANGKIDEFAAQKMLNAWEVVKGFIAREDIENEF